MADTPTVESEAQTRGVSAPTARVTIGASDRSLDIATHDQDVLSFFHRMGAGFTTEVHLTFQELADALNTLGVTLPEGHRIGGDEQPD